MNVLVACEESQTVCSAFRSSGHLAFSCDLQPCSGGFPFWHIVGDATNLLAGGYFMTMDNQLHFVDHWDLLIAHPPCTFLSKAGARWLFPNKELNFDRYLKGLSAAQLFYKFLYADIPMICVENPQPCSVFHLPEPSQIIQPYQFGHPFSKRTFLWLKNLPLLEPTEVLSEYRPYLPTCKYSYTHDPFYAGASRCGGSSKQRSKTFAGIAAAMADQWGCLSC